MKSRQKLHIAVGVVVSRIRRPSFSFSSLFIIDFTSKQFLVPVFCLLELDLLTDVNRGRATDSITPWGQQKENSKQNDKMMTRSQRL